MKKIFPAFLLLPALLWLTACGGGNIDKVEIPDWKPSELYTDEEIEAAFRTVEDYFSKEFSGCTLTKLYYPGDTFSGAFQEWAAQYEADEAIIICSSFDVDASGGDGSLNPNSTYDDWQWILVRNDGGSWKHVDHGY